MDPKSIDLKSIRNSDQHSTYPLPSSVCSTGGRSYSIPFSEENKLTETGQKILQTPRPSLENFSMEKKNRRIALLRQNSESIIQRASVPTENIIVENSFGRFEAIHQLSEKIRPEDQKQHIVHFIEGKAFIHVDKLEEEKAINSSNKILTINGKTFKLKAKKIAPSLYKKLQIILDSSVEQHFILQEIGQHEETRKEPKKIEFEKNQIQSRRVFFIKKTEKKSDLLIFKEDTLSLETMTPIKIKEEISNAAIAIEENRKEKRKRMREQSVNRIEKNERQKSVTKEANLKENLNQTFEAEMELA